MGRHFAFFGSCRFSRLFRAESSRRIVLVATCFCVVPFATEALGEGELIRGSLRRAAKLDEALYPPVISLIHRPDKDVLPVKQPDASSLRMSVVERMSREWISRVLATHWHPASDFQFQFTEAEFDGRDTVRAQWVHEGWKVQLSQTASVMTIRLLPIDTERGTGRSSSEKFESARDLCQDLFAKTATLRNMNRQGEVDEVNLSNLNRKIAGFSFDRRKLVELSGDKALVGRALTQEDEKIPNGPLAGAGLKGINIERSPIGFSFWFRHVDWWNDGQSIGFHFLKINGPGAWIPSYGGDTDRDWFRAKSDRRFFQNARDFPSAP